MTTTQPSARRRLATLALLALAFLPVLAGAAAAQEPDGGEPDTVQANVGTAFTYQGRLVDAGNPADGVYDFQFRLFEAAVGGAQIGGTDTVDDVTVSDGLFTVTLDFGAGAFDGQARWLAIDVKRDVDGSYTTLSPRVALTPAPHALALPGLWTQQNATSPNLVGGYHGNVMGAGVQGGVIAGGGTSAYPNQVHDRYNTIGGGYGNVVGSNDGTPANHLVATVAGGSFNEATSGGATVSGGRNNTAAGSTSTVGGGWYNRVAASYATISGGGPSDTGNPTTTNKRVYDDYGVIGGGGGNVVGIDDANSTTQTFATVGGGMSNSATANYTTVGGGLSNSASADRATVGGGGRNTSGGLATTVGGGDDNDATGTWSTVGGGVFNHATNLNSAVGGGQSNSATGHSAVVAGGLSNEATNTQASVGGGATNSASGNSATIGGGFDNTASGSSATVPGGNRNTAAGAFSFAAGRRAKANHDGAFVWADSTDADYASNAANTFNVRAASGVIVDANNNGNGLQVVNNGSDAVGIYVQNTGSGKDDATLRANNTETSGGVTAYLTNDSNFATVHAYNDGIGEVLYLQNGGTDAAGTGGGDFIKAINQPQNDTQFRVSTTGEVFSDVGYNSVSADIAELLPAAAGLEPGDVLAIGPDGLLVRSSEPYQSTVVGVYSTRPGFVGGMPVSGETAGKVPLAVVGIVPVKASAEGGKIEPGDLLAASSTPGHAMRCQGAESCFGRTIGKALEPLDGDTGVITMLVILQ